MKLKLQCNDRVRPQDRRVCKQILKVEHSDSDVYTVCI
jgi:hypothetical protein